MGDSASKSNRLHDERCRFGGRAGASTRRGRGNVAGQLHDLNNLLGRAERYEDTRLRIWEGYGERSGTAHLPVLRCCRNEWLLGRVVHTSLVARWRGALRPHLSTAIAVRGNTAGDQPVRRSRISAAGCGVIELDKVQLRRRPRRGRVGTASTWSSSGVGSSPGPASFSTHSSRPAASKGLLRRVLTRSVLAFGCAPHAASGRALAGRWPLALHAPRRLPRAEINPTTRTKAMTKSTTHSDRAGTNAANTAGFPPAPPEAYRRAAVTNAQN